MYWVDFYAMFNVCPYLSEMRRSDPTLLYQGLHSYGHHKLKPSYCVVVIDVMSLLVLYGRPRSTMDAVLAIIFDGGQGICQKHK